MIKQISLFLAKILAISVLVTLGLSFMFPNLAQAQAGVNATLNVISKDSQGVIVSGVNVYVYEQLTDVNGQPVLGNQLASGNIGDTGSTTITVKNSNVSSLNTVVVYYKSNFSKYTLWNQMLSGTQTKNINLVYSTARVVLKDQNGNLLNNQAFELFASGIDANANKVATNSLQSYQKTGTLGYITYYLAPADYFIKANNQTYLFTVTANGQTNVNIVINQNTSSSNNNTSNNNTTSTSVNGTLVLVAKDSNGNKVSNVNFYVYKQISDINNNPVLGDQLASGKIGDVGSQTVTVKNQVNTNLPIAILYYVNNRDYEKFYLYNQNLNGGETKAINLPFSGVNISVRDYASQILVNASFDLNAVLKDKNNYVIGEKNLYSGQQLGDLGYKFYYLVPGEYILRVKAPVSNIKDSVGYRFTISNNQITNLNYQLNTLRVSVYDINGQIVPNAGFKLSQAVNNDNSNFADAGSYATDSSGYKTIQLPTGDYKVTAKSLNGKYDKTVEFTFGTGQYQDIQFNTQFFYFYLADAYRNPLNGVKVTVYNFTNNTKQSQVFSGITDNNGQLKLSLGTGDYIADIDYSAYGLKYTSQVFHVDETNSGTYHYYLSLAHIYLINTSGQNLAHQKFSLYTYSTNSSGTPIPGKLLGDFDTADLGYAEIYLPTNRYIVKTASNGKLTAIFVDANKINDLYVFTGLNLQGAGTAPTPIPAPITPAPVTNPVQQQVLGVKYVNTPSIYTNDNLYNQDSDHDTLTNFEEKYIWNTNPFKADSDGDGYPDALEIRSGFDPNGPGHKAYTIWGYDKPRVSDLRVEQVESAYLKTRLTKRLGYTPKLSATNWNTFIKAFVYGGYTVAEIQHDIKYGPLYVSPTIPAYKWRVMRTK